jgi:hypothetical protein
MSPTLEEPPANIAMLRQYLRQYDEETIAFTLGLAPLLSNLRSVSRFSVRTALEAYASGVNTTLSLHLQPKAKTVGERVEARLQVDLSDPLQALCESCGSQRLTDVTDETDITEEADFTEEADITEAAPHTSVMAVPGPKDRRQFAFGPIPDQ